MDPLSITASVVALTETCLKARKLRNDLKESYKQACVMLSAFCLEATGICTTLSQIQTMIMQQPEATVRQPNQRSELVAMFDIAMTGCIAIFSVLDEEMQSLLAYVDQDKMSFTTTAKYMLNKDLMKDLLNQLRGQQQGVTLLQAIQMEA